MGFLVLVGILVFIVSLVALFGGSLMKMFGFTYQSIGSIILFFTISGILAFPIELFVKAIPKVLFSHFKKVTVIEAKITYCIAAILLNAILTMWVVETFMWA